MFKTHHIKIKVNISPYFPICMYSRELSAISIEYDHISMNIRPSGKSSIWILVDSWIVVDSQIMADIWIPVHSQIMTDSQIQADSQILAGKKVGQI